MSATLETRVYRGGSLEELLPQIREELGPDAIITRQREGIIGGIGGFFGRRCVEVEAQCAAEPTLPPPLVGEKQTRPAFLPPLPTRAVIDLYDSDASWSGNGHDPWAGEPEAGDDEPMVPFESPLLRTVFEQASPFATELESALSRESVAAPASPPAAAVPPLATAAPAETPALEAASMPEALRAAPVVPAFEPAPPPAAAPVTVARERFDLVATGLPEAIAAEIMSTVEAHVLPFTPSESLADLVCAELARRIRVQHGWRGKRRTIALVGPAGAGKTLAAAKLCRAYVAGGHAVAALSLEPARNALRLGVLTDGLGVDLDVAECLDGVPLAVSRLKGAAVVVADTPSVALTDAAGVAELARLVRALKPDEIHFVMPADLTGMEPLLDAIRTAGIKVDRLLVTFAAETGAAGAAIGLSLSAKLPISYVGTGDDVAAGLRPADPCTAARLTIRP